MENWLYSLKEWWLLHGPDVKRYGFCALMVAAGIQGATYLLAWMGLAGAFCMFAYDRYDGAYWQQRGAQVLSSKKNKTNPEK